MAYGAYCGRERDTLLGNNVHTGGVQGEEEEGLFKANAVKEEEEESLFGRRRRRRRKVYSKLAIFLLGNNVHNGGVQGITGVFRAQPGDRACLP